MRPYRTGYFNQNETKVIAFRVSQRVYNYVKKLANDKKTSISSIIEEMFMPVLVKKFEKEKKE